MSLALTTYRIPSTDTPQGEGSYLVPLHVPLHELVPVGKSDPPSRGGVFAGGGEAPHHRPRPEEGHEGGTAESDARPNIGGGDCPVEFRFVLELDPELDPGTYVVAVGLRDAASQAISFVSTTLGIQDPEGSGR